MGHGDNPLLPISDENSRNILRDAQNFRAISKFLYALFPLFLAEPWSTDIDLHGS